jgi:hypothetical protein
MNRQTASTAEAVDPFYFPISQYSLPEIETAAFRQLDAVSAVLRSARAVQQKVVRPVEHVHHDREGRRTSVWRVAPTPAHRLLADYLALYEFDGFPEASGPALEWLNRAITACRPSTLRLSVGPVASAFQQVWMLPEAALPVPHDPFRTWPIFDLVRRALSSDPAGVPRQPTVEFSVPRGSPVLRAYHQDLSLAFVCGFTACDMNGVMLDQPHQKLAATIAHDPAIRGALRRVRLNALANFLAEMGSDDDLAVLSQELQWEFARVSERVTGLIPPPPDAGTAAPKSRRGTGGKRPKPDPRARFAYRLVLRDVSRKEARTKFNAEAARRGWDEVTTDNGVKYLAARHARDQGLGPIPPRRPR